MFEDQHFEVAHAAWFSQSGHALAQIVPLQQSYLSSVGGAFAIDDREIARAQAFQLIINAQIGQPLALGCEQVKA